MRSDEGIELGAAVSLTDVLTKAKELIAELPTSKVYIIVALCVVKIHN